MQATLAALKPSKLFFPVAILLFSGLLNVVNSLGPDKWQRGGLVLIIVCILAANTPSRTIGPPPEAGKPRRNAIWAIGGIMAFYMVLMLGSLLAIDWWPARTIIWGWGIYIWAMFLAGCAVVVYFATAGMARERAAMIPTTTILAAMVAWLFLAYNGVFFKPALTPAQFAFFTVGLGFLVPPIASIKAPLSKYRIIALRIAYVALVAMMGLELL